MREHSRRPRGDEKGARAGCGHGHEAGGVHGRFAQIKNDTKLDAIVVPGNRPHVTARSHTGRTLQCPVRPGSHPNQACVQGPAASGCGLAARRHNRARRVHRAERPARVRALGPAACRAAAASSGRGTIWTYGVANVDQTLIRKTRPASDEEIRHAVEGRPGSRAPAKWATSSHGERSRAPRVITCQKWGKGLRRALEDFPRMNGRACALFRDGRGWGSYRVT